MDKKEAYKIVYEDMVLNGPSFFRGTHDAKNGNRHFMYGLATALEYVAQNVSDDTFYEFVDMFYQNYSESELGDLPVVEEQKNVNKRQKIIGVDFDDTLFFHSYPNNYTEPNIDLIDYLKNQQKNGAYLILITCRHTDEDLQSACSACKKFGLVFDSVNENKKSLIDFMGDTRKIFCNEYIDDKNYGGLPNFKPK